MAGSHRHWDITPEEFETLQEAATDHVQKDNAAEAARRQIVWLIATMPKTRVPDIARALGWSVSKVRAAIDEGRALGLDQIYDDRRKRDGAPAD